MHGSHSLWISLWKQTVTSSAAFLYIDNTELTKTKRNVEIEQQKESVLIPLGGEVEE